MSLNWNRNARAACLALGFAATLSIAGCGGDTRNAVVHVEPGASVTTSPNTAAAPAAGATKPAETIAASTTSTPTKSEGWGTLKGQVVFGSNPPALADLVPAKQASKDPTVCAKDGPIKSETLVVDPATKGVKNVFVYIPKPTAVKDDVKAAAAAAKVEFDQVGCVFKPHVLAVLSSAKLTLKSSDPGINHNVNAKLKAGAPYNQIFSMGKPADLAFTGGERSPVEVTCDIHNWMKGYWLILDSPYYAVTDDKGNFEIKNAPAGTQKVVVWQEAVKGGFVTPGAGEEVVIKADDTTTKSFTIDPGKLLPTVK